MGSATHLRFKRNDFQNHLDSEHPGEDHVQDVHGVIKHLGLLVVLWMEAEAQFSGVHSRLAKGGSPAHHPLQAPVRLPRGQAGNLPGPAPPPSDSTDPVRAHGWPPTKRRGP